MSDKKLISFRIDSDIVDWFKKSGRYQTRMREVLREYVDNAKLKSAHSIGRAQELYRKYHAQCFWHYKKDLIIDENNFHLVIEGLRKYGGREGYLLADELCQ